MGIEAFNKARDFLLTHRADYATAYAGFSWPKLEKFNWALDWFDGVLARGALASSPALRITGAGEAELSFFDLSERSNRVANGLRRMGVAIASSSCSATSPRCGR
jgi:acetyl-CoA synthetase